MSLTSPGFYKLTYQGFNAVGYCENLGPIGTEGAYEQWTVIYEAPDGILQNTQKRPFAVTYAPATNLPKGWVVGTLITAG